MTKKTTTPKPGKPDAKPAKKPTTPKPGKPDAKPAKKPARGRQGDQNRPRCKICRELMKAASSPAPGIFTWYACPHKCPGSRTKILRPGAAEALAGKRKKKEAQAAAAAKKHGSDAAPLDDR